MAGADMCSVGYKSVLPNKNRQMTYTHQGNCRSSVCRSKGGRPLGDQGGPGGQGGPGSPSGLGCLGGQGGQICQCIWFTWSKQSDY